MKDGFTSKPATSDPYKTKNSTATYGKTNGDEGAARVNEPMDNPFGPTLKSK